MKTKKHINCLTVRTVAQARKEILRMIEQETRMLRERDYGSEDRKLIHDPASCASEREGQISGMISTLMYLGVPVEERVRLRVEAANARKTALRNTTP